MLVFISTLHQNRRTPLGKATVSNGTESASSKGCARYGGGSLTTREFRRGCGNATPPLLTTSDPGLLAVVVGASGRRPRLDQVDAVDRILLVVIALRAYANCFVIGRAEYPSPEVLVVFVKDEIHGSSYSNEKRHRLRCQAWRHHRSAPPRSTGM